MRLLALPCFALLLASCGSPIVGAECRDGFTNCDGECVDLANDPDHCGGCDDECGRFTCEESECTTEPRRDGGGDGDGDGDGPDGGGTGGRDGGITPIGTGNPFLPDGGFVFPDPNVDDGCSIGTLFCDGECINPQTSHEHCGGCDMPCAGDQFCALGMCVDFCNDPLSLCIDACVDYQNDPFNCGGCKKACASGICQAGMCSDVLAGHVVVVGHDYRRANNVSIRRIAYNSLFLAGGSPVQAVFYRGDASARSIEGVRSAINNIIALDGRSWVEHTVPAEQITSELVTAQALLIPAQNNASDARLRELGQMWGLALTQFVARGGVIVLFETTETDMNEGTFQILEPSGLFAAGSVTAIAPTTKLTVDQSDGVAYRATEQYPAFQTTVVFNDVVSPGRVVVAAPDGRPVVIHRYIAP